MVDKITFLPSTNFQSFMNRAYKRKLYPRDVYLKLSEDDIKNLVLSKYDIKVALDPDTNDALPDSFVLADIPLGRQHQKSNLTLKQQYQRILKAHQSGILGNMFLIKPRENYTLCTYVNVDGKSGNLIDGYQYDGRNIRWVRDLVKELPITEAKLV